MYLFYFFAIIPLIAWVVSFLLQKGNIHYWEAIIGTAIAFLVALIFNLSVGFSMTQDKEMWSGSVIEARYVPAWTEQYEEAIYRTEITVHTDSDGNTYTTSEEVFDHWETRTAFHNKKWDCEINYGSESSNRGIDEGRYEDIKFKFGNKIRSSPGRRSTFEHNSHMISGDPNDYFTVNTTNYIYPTVTQKRFENRVIAAPTVYHFEEVPPEAGVFEWPELNDTFSSDRVMGNAKQIFSNVSWDQLNARLGWTKRVNIIVIGFGQSSIDQGYLQQSKFKGGKKNDLVITYGGSDNKNPSWAYCFGWTDKELVKKNIESIFLNGKLNNSTTISEIEQEIIKNYELKHFEEDFKYITIEPTLKHYIIYFIVMIITQVGLHLLFTFNNWKYGKKEEYYRGYRRIKW